MELKKKAILILIAIGFLISFFALGLYFFFYPKDKIVSFVSPDQKRNLVIVLHREEGNKTKDGTVDFYILDRVGSNNSAVYQTGASWWQNWNVTWINNKKIKFESSDIGTFCWQEEQEQVWNKISC